MQPEAQGDARGATTAAPSRSSPLFRPERARTHRSWRQAGLKYLLERWQVAQRRVRERPVIDGTGVVEHWSEVADLVITLPLASKGGPAVAALIVAIQHQGMAWGTVRPAISRLALEITGAMTRTRVENVIISATSSGLVRCHRPLEEGARCQWEVNVVLLRQMSAAFGGGCPEGLSPNRNHPALLLWNDVWHEEALGLAGWRLYAAVLFWGRASHLDLAQAVGGHPRVVRSRLLQLEAAGLLEQKGDEWSSSDLCPWAAAELHGWAGLAEQRELHSLADHDSRNAWFEQRKQAVAKVERSRQSYRAWKNAVLDASPIIQTGSGGMRWTCLDVSRAAYRASPPA
jgi:hypothetical protein